MTAETIIPNLLGSSFEWGRVNDLPCIHTFQDQFYINLCFWHPGGVPTLSIDVDDIEEGLQDIVALHLQPDNENFDALVMLYEKARDGARNIAA